MNSEKEQFPKPRALRNTARQSILIIGHPDFLYKDKEIKETFISFDGKKKSIGKISDDVHIALEDLSKGKQTKIIRETKKLRVPISSIDGFPGTNIRKHGKDTMIVVQAANESSLIEKVNKLRELLESNGSILQERCNWMCVVDKGKVNISNEEILKKEQLVKIEQELKTMSGKTNALYETSIKAASECWVKKEQEINTNPYSDNPPQTWPEIKKSTDKEVMNVVNKISNNKLYEMSEKTKALHEIAMKAVKENGSKI